MLFNALRFLLFVGKSRWFFFKKKFTGKFPQSKEDKSRKGSKWQKIYEKGLCILTADVWNCLETVAAHEWVLKWIRRSFETSVFLREGFIDFEWEFWGDQITALWDVSPQTFHFIWEYNKNDRNFFSVYGALVAKVYLKMKSSRQDYRELKSLKLAMKYYENFIVDECISRSRGVFRMSGLSEQ